MGHGMPSLQAFDGRLADTAALMVETGMLRENMKSGAHQQLMPCVDGANARSGMSCVQIAAHQALPELGKTISSGACVVSSEDARTVDRTCVMCHRTALMGLPGGCFAQVAATGSCWPQAWRPTACHPRRWVCRRGPAHSPRTCARSC